MVYVSGNNDNLLATKTTSIDNYFTTVKKQAANAPANAIVKPCPNPTDYSNMTDCFSCQSEEYFNVETYKCVTCNGTVDPATNICVPLTTLVTNLTAPNLLLTGDSTLQNYVDLEAKIAQPKQVCPANLPYTPNGKSCIACKANTPYFDLALKTCVDCKANEAYLSSTRKCVSAQTVTNTNNLTNYIESDTSTLASLKTEISKINGPVAPCPVETPYYDGKNCMNCPTATPYFNLETKTCVNCPKGTVYSPTARKCAVYVTNTTNLQNYIESKNYTLPNVKTQIAESKTPTQPCPPVTPYFSVSECINCPTATPYFNL